MKTNLLILISLLICLFSGIQISATGISLAPKLDSIQVYFDDQQRQIRSVRSCCHWLGRKWAQWSNQGSVNRRVFELHAKKASFRQINLRFGNSDWFNFLI